MRTDMTGRVDAQFTELYERTHEKVARYCLRRLPPDDARDALTDTYLVAWRRAGDLPTQSEQVLWLYGIARNVVRNKARSSRRMVRLRAKLATEPQRSAPDPVHQVIRNESDAAFLAVVDSLPPGDQEVLKLRAFEGLEYDEIALVLGCSNGAARQRLSRALKKLESRLTEDVADGSPRAAEEGGIRNAG